MNVPQNANGVAQLADDLEGPLKDTLTSSTNLGGSIAVKLTKIDNKAIVDYDNDDLINDDNLIDDIVDDVFDDLVDDVFDDLDDVGDLLSRRLLRGLTTTTSLTFETSWTNVFSSDQETVEAQFRSVVSTTFDVEGVQTALQTEELQSKYGDFTVTESATGGGDETLSPTTVSPTRSPTNSPTQQPTKADTGCGSPTNSPTKKPTNGKSKSTKKVKSVKSTKCSKSTRAPTNAPTSPPTKTSKKIKTTKSTKKSKQSKATKSKAQKQSKKSSKAAKREIDNSLSIHFDQVFN
jgi:cobalamin biosynthesis Mg chelatase CobN